MRFGDVQFAQGEVKIAGQPSLASQRTIRGKLTMRPLR